MPFYHVPKFIFNPVAESNICSGTILLPADFDGQLYEQIKNCGFSDVILNKEEANIQNSDWWKSYKDKVDWVVAITQGLKEYTP